MEDNKEIDVYGENTYYISNKGYRLYSFFEYVLDVIETNLNCYSTDIFRNEKKFGVDGFDLQKESEVKKTIESILKNRLSEYNITYDSADISEGQVKVTLKGSFGLKSFEINIEESDKKNFFIQKIEKN